MRLAELADIRRRIADRDRRAAPVFDLIEFENLPGFETVSIQPRVGLLAIRGGTGVGKTAVLELIYAGLRSSDDIAPPNAKRIEGARIQISVSLGDVTYQGDRSPNEEGIVTANGYEPGVDFIESDVRSSYIKVAFLENDIQVLKEGVDAKEIDKKILQALALICGKNYDSAHFYEIEVADRTIPLFEIVNSGISYDNRTMSTGELSAFYIAWVCLRAETFGLVLIEEPEAYLPPSSHAAIFALVARLAMDRRLGIIITTHSAYIISEIHEKSILPVIRLKDKSAFPRATSSKEKALRSLGLRPKTNTVVFVEDKMAQVLAFEMFGKFDFNFLTNIDISVIKNGSGDFRKIINGLPTQIKICKFIGILDGDMRKSTDISEFSHPVIFMPFQKQAEIELIEAIQESINAFSRSEGRDIGTVTGILGATEGQNYHDRFSSIANQLGMTEEALARSAFRIWSKGRRQKSALDSFAREFSRLISAPT